MMKIRAAQMEVFEKDAEQRFKERLAAHLAEFLPPRGVTLTEAGIRDQIERGLAQTPDFGLELQCDIARCFEIVCGYAGGFTGKALPKDALNILYGYRVDPALKLDQLQAWADRRQEGAR